MAPFSIRLVHMFCALLAGCLAFSACRGTSRNTKSASDTIIYLVRDAQASRDSGDVVYHLMSVTINNPSPQEIARLAPVNGSFSVDPDHRRVALATDYTDKPELLFVDISSGAVSRAMDSQGGDHSVALGPQGAIAFSNSKGEFKVGNANRLDQSVTIERHHPAEGCPDSGWRADSTLAFVAETPLNDPEPGQAQALYMRAPDGALSSIELPGILGSSRPSWSSDGERVAFSARDGIVVVDTGARDVKTIGAGSDPIFAPDKPNRLVALRFVGHDRFIDVWDKNSVVASLKFDEAGLAWCPGGDEVALATLGGVWIWNWRTGETHRVVDAQFLTGQLVEASVACY